MSAHKGWLLPGLINGVLGVGLVLGGCGTGTAGAPLTVRDSAGVRIITVPAATLERVPDWPVAARPELDMGAADGPGPDVFDRIAAVARLGDGRVVVADGGSSEVRFYDATGRFLHRTGGRGGGPGEYTFISGMGVGPGDSLWVYDFGARRFTVLAAGGAVVRIVTVGTALSSADAVGRWRDGAFALREHWGAGVGAQGGGLERAPAAVTRLSGDGSRLDTLGLFPGREVFIGSEGGRTVMSQPLFGHSLQVAMGANLLAIGDPADFAVSLYDEGGRLRVALRVRGMDLSLGPALVRQAMQERLSAVRDVDRPALRRQLESMDMPATRPAYAALRIAAGGQVWIEEYRVGTGPATWWVFDPARGPIGRVTLPAGFTLEQAGDDWVLGVWRDPQDVEHVRSYRFTPTADPA